MADGVRVRRATAADAAAIASISVRGWRNAFRGLVPDGHLDGRSEETEEPRWRAYLEREPERNRTFVAEVDGTVAGFARSGYTDEGVPELFGLYADPDRLGTGVGRALLEHVRADFRARGETELVLWTFVGNERADRFYRRAGLEPDGTTGVWRNEEFSAPELRYRGAL